MINPIYSTPCNCNALHGHSQYIYNLNDCKDAGGTAGIFCVLFLFMSWLCGYVISYGDINRFLYEYNIMREK